MKEQGFDKKVHALLIEEGILQDHSRKATTTAPPISDDPTPTPPPRYAGNRYSKAGTTKDPGSQEKENLESMVESLRGEISSLTAQLSEYKKDGKLPQSSISSSEPITTRSGAKSSNSTLKSKSVKFGD